MKTTDHNIETLQRHLKEEAADLRRRAERLESLSQTLVSSVRTEVATVHTFEFVAQEAIDIITHRSNVHPQSIARVCSSLAADAAVEWADAQREAAFKAALAAEMSAFDTTPTPVVR